MISTQNVKRISWTDPQVEKLLSEVLDKSKILLHCGEHGYVGSNLPPKPIGCKNCWHAYYWYMFASTPPHLREERLEALEKSLHDAVALAEKGQFDFEPFARPEISTEVDGYPDQDMPNFRKTALNPGQTKNNKE